MGEIKLLDLTTKRTWIEKFSSPYLMNKRINKIKHSKKLQLISYFTY